MHVAKVEYGEAVKKRRQHLEQNVIALQENASCIPASAPVETGQLQCVSNDRMDRIPVLYVKGEQAFAEDLRLVVPLDTHSLSCASVRDVPPVCARYLRPWDNFLRNRLDVPCGHLTKSTCAIGHISSPSAAPKAMQGDFRRTVKAHRNDAGSCAHRGVAAHVVILSCLATRRRARRRGARPRTVRSRRAGCPP